MTSDYKILIADDDPDIIELIKGVLVSIEPDLNWDFEDACDGEDALGKIEINSYDLMILDIKMPKKDGMSVIYDIRRGDSSNKNIPIIVVSGYLETVSLNQSNVYYISKPLADFSLKSIFKLLCQKI